MIDNFLSPSSLADTARQAARSGSSRLGEALVVIVGGIDLSVGSMFALTDFCALYTLDVLGWPVVAVIAATIACGALLGAVNGLLIGYLRLRAFITTLITLIIYRSAFDLLIQRYSNQIASAFPDFPSWNFIGGGDVFGVPSIAIVYLAVAIFGHVFMTRLRPGWHITAIGGSRRSAYNSGIAVRRTIALCYVACGALTAVGALFFAARLGTVGGDIGVGLEVIVLTATVLGGITLGGGKGSVTKSAVGTLIVLLITNGLTTMNARGGFNRLALASILLVAAMIDIRWQKNRTRIISKVYVSPTYHDLPPPPTTEIGKGGPFEQNDRLRDVELIGLGRIEAPEDVILDRHDNLYAGSRHGDVIRFFAPDYQRMEVFAHIGGQPLGMAFDRSDNLYICIGGMGLYRIAPDGKVEKATDETNRSWRSVNDDSRLRLADDLDITDDGRIFFSEATIRYEMDEWPVDGLEARGNGRIICYDTQDRQDAHRGARPQVPERHLRRERRPVDPVRRDLRLLDQALLVRRAEEGRRSKSSWTTFPAIPTTSTSPRTATTGSRSSACAAPRSISPGACRRSAPAWPNGCRSTNGCSPTSTPAASSSSTRRARSSTCSGTSSGVNHPMITSMREHRGYLYLGGIANNRIGRYKLDGADPNFVQYEKRWGRLP